MSKVYFTPIAKISDLSTAAAKLLAELTKQEGVTLEKELPIKNHPGAIGNTAYLKPENFKGMIALLKEQGVTPYYIETCMEGSKSTGKENEFKEHGFTDLPVVIADGKDGIEDVEVAVPNGANIKYSLIGKKLAEAKQVLVVSHFKGHCMAGFGGAIKMLGIGFASGRGKTLVHGIKDHYDPGDKLDWDSSHLPGISEKWVKNWSNIVSSGAKFNERVAESALAASLGKKHIHIMFAIDIVTNCDCDGEAMTPVYKDVGIFASLDPVAIDKAAFDKLQEQVGDVPFAGEDIFEYATKLGLGSSTYKLVEV